MGGGGEKEKMMRSASVFMAETISPPELIRSFKIDGTVVLQPHLQLTLL